jgi:K+-sensing histidine kinase KdpD
VLLTVSLMESHPNLPPELRGDVAIIRRNVELESRLISDLLDLTRIARGKLQLDLQDVDLHLVIRSPSISASGKLPPGCWLICRPGTTSFAATAPVCRRSSGT